MITAPLSVHVTRGDTVESAHRVHAVVLDKDGDVLESRGDTDLMVLPRSALKSIQALPLVESGALDAFGLGAAELALACASHNAEQVHIDAVAAWLDALGLDEGALACGGHLSINTERAHDMIRLGENLTPLYSDCSGKHAGMLTTALHIGAPTGGYVRPDHPVQKRIRQTLSEMAAYDVADIRTGTDGCSAPNPALPLGRLARAFACFMNPASLDDARAAACTRVLDAMAAHPYMVAGRGRFDTVVSEQSGGNILAKVGAEGNYLCWVRDRGMTIYLKAEDGAGRAALAALGAILRHVDALDENTQAAVAAYTSPPQKNWSGIETGEIIVEGLE